MYSNKGFFKGTIRVPLRVYRVSGIRVHVRPSLVISYTTVGVPYHNYSIMGSKILFKLLRPLYYRILVELGCTGLGVYGLGVGAAPTL